MFHLKVLIPQLVNAVVKALSVVPWVHWQMVEAQPSKLWLNPWKLAHSPIALRLQQMKVITMQATT